MLFSIEVPSYEQSAASDPYGSRQLASMRVPGALLSEMTFTL
jgi:hypothetical protein